MGTRSSPQNTFKNNRTFSPSHQIPLQQNVTKM
ncbi:hypothetical protein CF65_02433 [Aggregatibacter actinomycetemcomitans HK1651]|nr:hypothetical protein CF65_02433 [Aggregatibacter actinomycetemcomitans HK1651]